jgi:hypothetical protein
MALRGIDIHAHYRTAERRQVAQKQADAEKVFKSADMREADPVA